MKQISEFDQGEVSKAEMENSLRRLNEKEQQCGSIVQEIITLLIDESIVDREIGIWTEFQQRILRASKGAERFISQLTKDEEAELRSVEDRTPLKECRESNSSSNLKLPKFTLPEFHGNMIEWVSWWDQFKSCIHENNTLGEREKFNYLRVYVKGSARKAIEYIEVTSSNYSKAIDALKKRYGRQRLVVEHLVESILNIEKRERVTAQSLRYLYDTLVNRYHTLEQYEPNLEVCHRILVPIFQSKLPNDIRRKWEYELSKLENEEEDKRVTAEFFFDFLRSHVMSEEAIEKSTPNRSTHPRMSNRPRIQNKDQGDSRFSSATALAAQTSQETVNQGRNNQNKCGFCEKNHESKKCFGFKKKSVDERIQTVKDKGLCFNCLKPISSTHYSSCCMSQGCMMEGCQRKHHTLLHRASSNPKTEVTKDEKVNSSERVEAIVASHVGVLNGIVKVDSENKMRLLPTAKAKLIQNGTETDVRILIDSGSDHSYIKQDIAESLGMQSEGPSKLMHGGQSRTIKVRKFKFTLTALDGSKSADVSAWAVDKVCAPLEAVPVDISKYRYLKGLKLGDSYPRQTANIDILLGSDQWGQILRSGLKKRDASSPIATNSIFGWMISGNLDVGSEYHPSNRATTNFATVKTIEEELNLDLKRFWQLESLGIDESEKGLTKDEESAMQQFKDSLVYDGERYKVALPFDCTGLEDNRQQAVSRLVKVEKRFQYDKEKASMYQDAINQYLKDGHARETDKTDSNSETKINYLPHHPVFRSDKVTTKCRVVFHASSKNKNGVSLNDCLLPGPVLQPNLVSIIIRFRLHRVALMADIRKMFLQIKLAKQDQNVHRFLWRDFDTKIEPKTYCMTRLTFGDVSSPFEAIATVQHHTEVNKESFPKASETIKENMYVDDCLTGAEDNESVFQLYQEATGMMKSGGFELVKWASNSKEVLVRIPQDQRATKNVIETESEGDPLKALGISWDTETDEFLFNQGKKLTNIQDQGTKRSLISISSKLFDPMGWLGPFSVRAKILYQELWTRGLDWDQKLDADLMSLWNTWKEDLKELSNLRIPRCFVSDHTNVNSVELHGFGDASPKAYGAVVYVVLKDESGKVNVQLVMSKNRVAPTKRLTLLRLELLAAFILSKLLKFVLESLKVTVDRIVCWSDSLVALSWIRRPSRNWKLFVANRVQSIQENVSPECWRFCPGNENPADLLTRGENLDSVIHNQLWWNGPAWLKNSEENWPENKLEVSPESETEMVKITVCNHSTTKSVSRVIDPAKYEKFLKLARVTAYVLRAVRNFKTSLRSKATSQQTVSQGIELTSDEIKSAEEYWYRTVQREEFAGDFEALKNDVQLPKTSKLNSLSPIFDHEKELIKVGGRLQFSLIPEESKHQIILPGKHMVVDKIIQSAHEREATHAGPETTLAITRERFWIIQGRRNVTRVIHRCLKCKRQVTKPLMQRMAPLPVERASPSPPFTHVGLDFTGHLFLKLKGSTVPQKAYVFIFTCASTRMVHFELTNDMTTDEFLQAFKRMYNRRGLCNTMWSDNQSTFKRANKDLQWIVETSKTKTEKIWKKIDTQRVETDLANRGIKWKFITERSPHRGGWWEGICRSLREPLRKILGKAFLTYVEMYTVLTEFESTVNSRPLTFVGESIKDGQVITPAHLALGRALKTVPDIPHGTQCEAPINDRYFYRQRLIGHFWKRWQAEYLPKLTVRQKWRNEVPPLQKGDVVLISEDNVKRSSWPLGMVAEVHEGADGLIRTVTVKTQKENFNRSIQKLHLLEGHKDPENHEIVQTKAYVPERATKTKPTGVRYVNVVR